MALLQELLTLLNNDVEPLPKRLKIADNAFKSCNLPIQHREAVLLDWLTKLTKTNDSDVWDLLLKWLQSVQVQNLNRSDVNYADLRNLNATLCKRLRYPESKAIATECILEIINNRNFQLYFKHNIEEHCKFIAKILLKIKSPELLHKVLTNEQLFTRNMTYGEDFYKNFVSHVLIPLSLSATDDQQLFAEASKLLENVLFTRNFSAFTTFFASGEGEFPKLLFEHLRSTNNAHLYRLVFHAFCKSYAKPNVIYACFAHLVEEAQNSVEILAVLCAVLGECGAQVNAKVDGARFNESFEKIVKLVIDKVAPSKATYALLREVIALDPVLMQKNLTDILRYILLHSSGGVEDEYATFMLLLFEVFAKLHRVSNLLTAMMEVLQTSVEHNLTIPTVVLSFFSQSVVTLPSWQGLDLFKILLTNLDKAVGNLGEGTNHNYLQFISVFLCEFLSSVRIADHAVPANIVENFEKLMLELKDVLRKFGTTLVGVEHRPSLMRLYLNVCFKWGELYMVLAYYSSDVRLKRQLDSDPSACNVTYLHSYLNTAQWRLISQRIANFGEKPCKKIMNSLCVQKLRAMNLFEAEVSSEATTAVAANLMSSIDEQDLLFDNFVLNNIIVPSSGVEIAELLVKTSAASGDFDQLRTIDANIPLVREILRVCFDKLNGAFAKKTRGACATSRMLGRFDKVTFRASEMACELNRADQTLQVNERKISRYLQMIKSVPIPQLDDRSMQEAVLMFLIGLSLDLRCCALQDGDVTKLLESIVIGILQNSAILNRFFEPNVILAIVNNFEAYSDIFTIIMEGVLKNKSRLELFREIVGQFTRNIDNRRYRDCAVILLNYVDKVKTKVAITEKHLHNEYREEICKCLLPFLLKNSLSAEDTLEAYALTLKFYLNSDSKQVLEELLPLLPKYIDALVQVLNPIRGSILLLTVMIHKKATFESIVDDVALKVWDCCNHLTVNDEDHERFVKVVQVTLQMITHETFAKTSSDLVSRCEKAIDHKETIRDEVKMWNAISACDLNSAQTKIWQNNLESLLCRTILTNTEYSDTIFEDIITLQMSFIKNSHFVLSPSLIEVVLITISKLNASCTNFIKSLNLSISLLETLVKHRKTVISDYLPPYLQRYRTVLTHLCARSNTNLKLDPEAVRTLANCAHRFERLTKALQVFDKSMTRIAPYVIADILNQFEKVTLYPNVKIHLGNSVYQLMPMCDEHGVAFLKRILSAASTEMFKIISDNYNKYYKFTGKV
uniref:Nucleolar 27S pre-rRNA processing Urb2/Npa2 C-terminal domain-containing protein n=1 Tax=Photinus pyralis TaxID=7054 RepID=A0A1Y1K0Y5_PHOPY